MNMKEALNSYVIINSNVQRVQVFCGLLVLNFFSSLRVLNEFHLLAPWRNLSQVWSPVLTAKGIHSLLSSLWWVCPSLALPLLHRSHTLLPTGLAWMVELPHRLLTQPNRKHLPEETLQPPGITYKGKPSSLPTVESVAKDHLNWDSGSSCIKDDAVQYFPLPRSNTCCLWRETVM